MVESSPRPRSTIRDMARHQTNRPDWVRASLLSGFVATFAMTATVTIGYGLAKGIALRDGNTLERWAYGLSDNRLTNDISDRFLLAMVANLVFGLIWAVAYAWVVGDVSTRAGWRSGALFSIIPWILSVAIFFPIAGAGFLGANLDAGPLPVLGNLVLHLVFGSVLGAMYAIAFEDGLDSTRVDRDAATKAERGAALGIAIGGILGAVGGWFMAGEFERLATQPVIALAGAFSGAAVGALLGSYALMSVEEEKPHLPDRTHPDQPRESMQEG